MENKSNTLQAGAIVTIPAVKDCPEFIVLEDNDDGYALCITKNTVGLQRFSDDDTTDWRNGTYDAEGNSLRKGVERWLAILANNGLNLDKVQDRVLYPSNGYIRRGPFGKKIAAKAYPLTLDEYGYFADEAPAIKEADKEWWLRTRDAARYIYAVAEDGSVGSYPRTAVNAVRPALIISKDILVEINGVAQDENK